MQLVLPTLVKYIPRQNSYYPDITENYTVEIRYPSSFVTIRYISILSAMSEKLSGDLKFSTVM